jgi:hypothetical protein
MEKNFSLSNPDILNYFNGDDTCAPIRELVYLHTHPLVQPIFLTEVNNLVVEAGNRLVSSRVSPTSSSIKNFERICIALGQNLPESTETAEVFLYNLRELFILCNKINKG